MRGEVRTGRREGVQRRRRKRRARRGSESKLGGQGGAERTWNMWFMVLTPEVSQLEISALKLRMP